MAKKESTYIVMPSGEVAHLVAIYGHHKLLNSALAQATKSAVDRCKVFVVLRLAHEVSVETTFTAKHKKL